MATIRPRRYLESALAKSYNINEVENQTKESQSDVHILTYMQTYLGVNNQIIRLPSKFLD